jgi:HEAT repeats
MRSHLVWLVAVVPIIACAPHLPDDLPGLMKAMGDYDMSVSWHAADKVRRLYGKEGLFQALQHANEYTRANAAHTLMHYSGPDVEEALVSVANDKDDHVRMWIAWSLGEVGSPGVRPTLERLSQDPADIVKRKAEEALVKLGERQSTPRR